MSETNKNKQSGFTLIELLVVISIIGLLSSLALASLNTARTKARDARRLTDVRNIITALEIYRDEYGIYPPNEVDYPYVPLERWDYSITGNSFIPDLINKGIIARPFGDPTPGKFYGYADIQDHPGQTDNPWLNTFGWCPTKPEYMILFSLENITTPTPYFPITSSPGWFVACGFDK